MPRWDPSPEWSGQDAYVVGGGDSLRHFDWDLIRGKNTIGCNSNFILGASIIKINIFGDRLWWEKIGKLQGHKFAGRFAACTTTAIKDAPDWLLSIPRTKKQMGLGTDKLAWNHNTGSLALNLALILGAKRVFLLGFDMKLGQDKKANWHDLRYESARPDVYPKFLEGWRFVARDLPSVFPGREVVNLTDDSELDYFPKVSLADHFGRKGTTS